MRNSPPVVLRELGREQALSAAALAKRAYVRPQAITPLIAGLEGRGLVERSPHPHNRRIIDLCLTAEGHQALAEGTRRFDAVEAQLLTGFGRGKRATFRAALDSCLADIDLRPLAARIGADHPELRADIVAALLPGDRRAA